MLHASFKPSWVTGRMVSTKWWRWESQHQAAQQFFWQIETLTERANLLAAASLAEQLMLLLYVPSFPVIFIQTIGECPGHFSYPSQYGDGYFIFLNLSNYSKNSWNPIFSFLMSTSIGVSKWVLVQKSSWLLLSLTSVPKLRFPGGFLW
jgi:hypothetical protein